MEYFYRFGKILLKLTCNGKDLTGVSFCENSGEQIKENQIHNLTPALKSAKSWLDIYFSGNNPDFTPPCELTGTAFQMRVWQRLCKIPYGQTVTYGEIAKQLAAETGIAKMSAQAVGGAVGKNPIAIIVPCHRVIGSGGSLTGFAGGIEVKKLLLTLENADLRTKNHFRI